MSAVAEGVRTQFPVLAKKTYLNSCSYGAMCVDVRNAIEEYINSRLRQGSDWDRWVERQEKLRGLLGQLLGCSVDDIALSSSVSESINSLASALDYSGGRDTVVVTDFDFPTASQIWLAQSPRGARVVRARASKPGNRIPVEQFERLVDKRTLLVSVPFVCYRNGARMDPGPIVKLCRERGAMVLVDAYQGLGSFPFNPRSLDLDFMVGGCLKYLIGTAGVAFMYVRDARRCTLQPTSTGWFAQENFRDMDITRHQPAATARRFESGTPNVCGLYAAHAGLAYLLKQGIDNVAAQVESLTAEIIRRASERRWQLATPVEPDRHGALIALRCVDAPKLVKRLATEDIVVSDRDGNLRISPHFYNNVPDIDRLFLSLEANAELIEGG